ncbi:MAG: hypothetical protein A2143_00595 [Gallionellales bacterium RBG_16_57_15]|nr:MAG: hypothetical protein A2143_00595 [Gallionellales bacterium RBG_16_57_15]
MLAKKANGTPLKAYDDLINQIVVERLTGDFVDSGMDSYALKWGREVEPHARQAYQFETGDVVAETTFVQHKTLSFVGASGDGLVGKDGGTEFKCPKNPAIHLDRFTNGMNKAEFMPQVQGCIWVYQRDWWDWVSFDPRMPQHLRFYRQRVYRDDAYIANMERAILLAEGEVRTRLENFTPERVEKILKERMTKQGEHHEPIN